MTSLKPGDRVERYEVQVLIGSGGMGSVYKVRHLSLDTLHALKVLMVIQPNLLARIMLEGRIQARLHHPNVVPVTDVLDVGGFPGLLMRYVDGPSLHQLLVEERLNIPQAASLFRGVVAAVGAAHEVGLVHRDLKPANVLLARERTGFRPMVADFGLVKVLSDGGEWTADVKGQRITRTGMGLGTPGYMAPEQGRDAARVDARADIYALGAILHYLVLGRPAFTAASAVEIIARQRTGALPQMGGCPTAIAEVIRRCLALDPEQRYPDCAALEVDFDQATANPGPVWVTQPELPAAAPDRRAPTGSTLEVDEPTTASAPVPHAAARPPGAPTPGKGAGSDTQASVTLSLTTVTSIPATPPPRVAPGTVDPPGAPPSRRAAPIVGLTAVSLLVAGLVGWSWLPPPSQPAAIEDPAALNAPPVAYPAVPDAVPPATADPVAPPTPDLAAVTASDDATVSPAGARPTDAATAPTRAPSARPETNPRASAAAPVGASAAPATAPLSADTVTVSPAPEAATPAFIKASSLPAGATVRLDGLAVGVTPSRISTTTGTHVVSLSYQGANHEGSLVVGASGARYCWNFESNTECP